MAQDRAATIGIGKRVVFSLVPALVLILALEIAVRLSGAATTCPALVDSPVWTCDPVLDFKMRPTIMIDGKPLDAKGFRGPALDPSARYTIVTMGDSTTFGYINSPEFFVHDPYPEHLQRIAVNRNGPGALSVFNAGVCGYNSYHGIMLLRTRLRHLRPKLMTVQYGWNDLLSSNAPPGAFHEPTWAVTRTFEDVLLLTALYPYGLRLGMELQAAWQPKQASAGVPWKPPDTWTPNLTVPEYEHNLRRIMEIARSRGATVWFITSADAFMTDEFRGREVAYGETAKQQLGLNRLGGIRDFKDLEDIHARYNDAVRRVGAELGVPVVDMERVFRQHASEHLFTAADAIHPNEAGHALEAETLYLRLKSTGVVGVGTRWGLGARKTP